MTALLDRVKKLADDFRMLQTATQELQAIGALRSRSSQLVQTTARLSSGIAAWRQVGEVSGPVKGLPRVSAALGSKPAALAARLTKDPNAVVRDQDWTTGLLSPVDEVAAKLTAAALVGWQAKVDQTAQLIDEKTQVQLESLGFADQVHQVQSVRARIAQIRAAIPANARLLQEITDLNKVMAAALARLEGVPPSVTAFLSKAASMSATYEDLTPECVEWLGSNGMLKSVRIGLR